MHFNDNTHYPPGILHWILSGKCVECRWCIGEDTGIEKIRLYASSIPASDSDHYKCVARPS